MIKFNYKKRISLFTFFFACTVLNAQLIERRIYNIVAPTLNQQEHRPTVGIPLLDGGFCIGGEVDYIIDNGGPQPFYNEKTFILKIDSNYNVVWIDTSDLMEDDGYRSHEVHTIFQTNDSGIVFDQTHEYSYIRNVTKNDLNGNRLWEMNFYDSINQANMYIGLGEIKNDTILYPGTKYYGLHHDPYIVIVTSLGDTVIYIDSSALGCTSEHRIQIVKDFSGNLYCVLIKENSNTIIHNINSDGSIISSYQIPYSGFITRFAKAIAISSNRIIFCYPSTSQSQYIYDRNQNTLYSTLLNSYVFFVTGGQTGNTLMLSLFNSGVPGSSLLPDGKNFLEIDSTGKPVWGYNFGSQNDSDVVTSVRQINSTDYVFLGNYYSSTFSDSPVLFEKIRRIQTINTLNIDTSFICEGDSVLITAPSGFSYKWNTGDSTQSIFAKAAGSYYALLSDTNGFFVASTSAIIRNPVLPYLGNDTMICTFQPLVLNAGAGYNNYLWSSGNTLQSITVSDSTSGLVVSNYGVTVIDTNGCVLSDTITVTFDICLRVPEFNLQEAFNVYPNPAQNKLIIRNKFNLDGEIKLIDYTGRCLLAIKLTSEINELHMDLSNIASGIYSLEYYSHNNSGKTISKISVIK
jgi:hypothetical protein